MPEIVQDYLATTQQLLLYLRGIPGFATTNYFETINDKLNRLYRLMTPEERAITRINYIK